MKKRLYIHIGTHKTGSTTIQNGLFINKEILRKNDINYPTTGMRSFGHHLLCFYLNGRIDHSENLIQNLRVELENAEQNTFIISSEEFEYLRTEHIQILTKQLHVFDIKIIIYLRNQASTIHSNYTQLVKTGLRNLPFDVYLDRYEFDNDRDNYNELLNKWENAVGIKNMIVKKYQKPSSEKPLITKFLEDCSLKISGLDINTDKNIAPSHTTLELIRTFTINCRKRGIPRHDFIEMARWINNFVENSGWNNEKANFLSEEHYDTIMQHYELSNASVSLKYFDRSPLFEKPIQFESLSQTEGLDVNKMGQLMAKVVENLYANEPFLPSRKMSNININHTIEKTKS